MPVVVPLHGGFDNPVAFLHHIAEDTTIAKFTIVIIHVDGTARAGHIGMTGADLAYASVLLAREAIDA
jgi:hypothetical protein